MDESIAINMLRVSLPDKGSSLSLDNNKLLSVIADTFSRDKELREVFVRMTESGFCERMYLKRQSPDFASYVQDNMESFMNNNSYESDVVQRTFHYGQRQYVLHISHYRRTREMLLFPFIIDVLKLSPAHPFLSFQNTNRLKSKPNRNTILKCGA